LEELLQFFFNALFNLVILDLEIVKGISDSLLQIFVIRSPKLLNGFFSQREFVREEFVYRGEPLLAVNYLKVIIIQSKKVEFW